MDGQGPCAVKTKKSRKGAVGIRRVRTGCLTCKIRHKKCDESKPACLKCVGTGRRCDFLYSVVQNPGLLRCVPQVAVGGLLQDKFNILHFEYFRDVCTKEFSLYFEVTLWQRLVLQAAYTEPCILHAVLAVGSLNRTMHESHEPEKAMDRASPSYEYPLKQYNLAIQELNRRLDKSPQSWELAILGSLLFIAVELLQGHDHGVRMHLRGAFAIMRGLSTANTSMQLQSADFSQLLNAFSRLDVQNTSSFPALQSNMPVRVSTQPSRFTSLDEARELLNSTTSTMHSILRKGTQEMKTLPYFPLPLSIEADISTVHSLLTSWLAKFHDLTVSHPIRDVKTTASIQILLIHHLVAQVQISTHFYRDQLVYDSHILQFQQIVHLAAAVAEADQAPAPPIRSGPCFILDIGIVQPLYFVARKCRDGIMRRTAIEIMEKVRKERVHDVQLLAGVARWISEMEEEGSGETGGVVMEEKRLHEVELDFDAVEGSCKVVGWRRRVDGNWEALISLISHPPSDISSDVLVSDVILPSSISS